MISQKNVKGSPKSTAIGILVVLASVVGFFAFSEVNIAEMVIGVVLGAGFIGIEDPRK
jgi:UDP-N-acetylmuramyl pentapeptide phosphotransferase/UDP-N-acetylglucosamine-1-phosphate transferase